MDLIFFTRFYLLTDEEDAGILFPVSVQSSCALLLQQLGLNYVSLDLLLAYTSKQILQ